MTGMKLSPEARSMVGFLADAHYARERITRRRPDLDTFSPMGQVAVLAEMGRRRDEQEDRSNLRAALIAAPVEEHEQLIREWQARTQGEQ